MSVKQTYLHFLLEDQHDTKHALRISRILRSKGIFSMDITSTAKNQTESSVKGREKTHYDQVPCFQPGSERTRGCICYMKPRNYLLKQMYETFFTAKGTHIIPGPAFFIGSNASLSVIFFQGRLQENHIKFGLQFPDIKGFQVCLQIPVQTEDARLLGQGATVA